MEAQTAALLGALVSAFTLSFCLVRRNVAGPVWYLTACGGVAALMATLSALYHHAWFMARLGGQVILLLMCAATILGKETADGFNANDT
jgi:hypothetical protein